MDDLKTHMRSYTHENERLSMWILFQRDNYVGPTCTNYAAAVNTRYEKGKIL